MAKTRKPPTPEQLARHDAWQRRGAERYQERLRAEGRRSSLQRPGELERGAGPKRSTKLRPINHARKARDQPKKFGPQAEWCRHLPCVACHPGVFLKMVVDGERFRRRISDPHHVKTRGAGGDDSFCVPLCRPHHIEIDGINGGRATFQRKYKCDLLAMANLLHERVLQLRGECAA